MKDSSIMLPQRFLPTITLYLATGLLAMTAATGCRSETTRMHQNTKQRTVVSVKGDRFLINGRLTYDDIENCPPEMRGLLFNVRSVNATFDDLTNQLPAGFLDDPGDEPNNNFAGYGPWDPNANTDRFIAALPSWYDHGIRAVTLNFQGGCSCTRHGEQGTTLAGDYQTPDNNPFSADGKTIHPAYLDRMGRCIDALDDLEMACILGIFYFGQDQRIPADDDSDQAIRNAVDAVVDWVIENGWRNVIIEINNETTVGGYQHEILTPQRVHELFERVKTRSAQPDGWRLLVSASSTGTDLPPGPWMQSADVFLPHGNGLNAQQIRELVDQYRAHPSYQADPRPICFNEDSTSVANLNAAAEQQASWGFYNDPHIQSVYPANWTIWSPEDKAFFNRVAELVGIADRPTEDQ
jgi:hypothetical protein